MKKLKIVGIFNEFEENYIKIKNTNNISDIKTIIKILDDLKITNFLGEEPAGYKTYKHWIGIHEYFREEDYIIHIIFAKNSIHFIVKCNLNKRKQLIKILKKYCEWAKVKIYKGMPNKKEYKKMNKNIK